MAIPQLSQAPFDVELRWYSGDPVSLSCKVLDVNWAGTYTGGVYRDAACTNLLAALTVTASFDSPSGDTTFTFTMSDAVSDSVPAGFWFYKVRETSGLTKFSGSVVVDG